MHVEGKEDKAPSAAEATSLPAAPQVVIKPLNFQVTAAKFLTESHGPFYTEKYSNFTLKDGPELAYVEKLEMPDGVYSGFMKTHPTLAI